MVLRAGLFDRAIRWATLERARDNDAVATLPTKLVYDPKGGTPGVLVSVPVYVKGTSRTTIPDGGAI